MSSKFNKYFNNIQNKESRFYQRLQDLDDLIYDRYFNDFAGKSSFVGEVLSLTNETDSIGPTTNSTLVMPIRIRIDGIHTNQIPDPYTSIQGLPTEEAAELFRTLILSHPVAFPDTQIYSDSAVSQPLNRGDRVEIFFSKEGPEDSGKQRGIRYGKVIAPAIARTVPTGVDISEVFSAGTISTVGSVEAMSFPKMNTISFIDRLKNHSAFAGYSDAALAGVAANANAESGFYSTAAGDKRVSGAAERSIQTKNGISGKEGKYCSFGFFQLNVCGQGAEGMLIAKQKGFMDENGIWKERGQQDFITFIQENNGDEQLKYVGARLIELGLDIGTDNAYDFGNLMCTNFEKPKDKEIKGRQRGATADKILQQYQEAKGA